MVERIGSRDARRMFADLLGRVRYGGEVIIVERSGTPMAAMVPIELAEQLLAERDARFEVLDRVREAAPATSAEEITQNVADAIASARDDRDQDIDNAEGRA